MEAITMISLQISHLTKAYHQTLFADFLANLEGRHVIGLIGDNGSGKSTLLRILAGQESADSGTYHFSDECDIGYLPQEIETLPGLSGGQKKIQEVRRLFFAEKKNVILLDEPDNHLDIEHKLWLEEVIKGFNGLLILISHDRTLLANLTDRVWLVSEESIKDYEFGYQKFVDFYQKELGERYHLFQTQDKERKRLEELVKLFRTRAARNSKLVGLYHGMEKRLVRHTEMMKAPPPVSKNSLGISVTLSKQHERKTAVFAQHLSKAYGNKQILLNAKLHLFCGEKIAVMGANGKGKSTFMKILAKTMAPDEGAVEYGTNLKVGYYSQDHFESLYNDLTPVEELNTVRQDQPFIHENYLKRFLFTKETARTPMKYLSGGQRSRVQLAKFLILNPEVLLLDEPTNHLDIASVEALEHFLLDYKGALVLISHDRQLVGNVAERIYTIEEGKLVEATGA